MQGSSHLVRSCTALASSELRAGRNASITILAEGKGVSPMQDGSRHGSIVMWDSCGTLAEGLSNSSIYRLRA